MAYVCQFCGEIEESDLTFRCSGCGGENVVRSASGMSCRECDDAVVPICPNCGSEELEK